MVKFGDQLGKELYPPWKTHYLDYKLLKKKLKLVKAANAKGDEAEKERKAMQFRECFDVELQKILSFYRYKEGEIKVWVNDLLADLEHCEDLSTRLSYAPNALADMNMLESRHKQWMEFAQDLIQTLRLEIPASLGGVIIGASDVTAMLATILYSVWTNKVFKNPLLFAAGCCVAGNIFYSLSFDLQSLTMLLLGRLLNGFGAARGIGRRYIADFVPKRHRTGASAAFVASSTET
eukprot:jgi/Pico_ML_1/52915/g3552.t1